jgi:hypothetical protein
LSASPCERRLDVVEFVELTRAIGADPVWILHDVMKAMRS